MCGKCSTWCQLKITSHLDCHEHGTCQMWRALNWQYILQISLSFKNNYTIPQPHFTSWQFIKGISCHHLSQTFEKKCIKTRYKKKIIGDMKCTKNGKDHVHLNFGISKWFFVASTYKLSCEVKSHIGNIPYLVHAQTQMDGIQCLCGHTLVDMYIKFGTLKGCLGSALQDST